MKRIAILFFVLIQTALAAQPPVPPLWGHRIHDEAHILSAPTLDTLEAMLKTHEDSTSNQIAVLIIPSLQGASLEQFSLHVAHDEWKLGRKEKDNGVLLLIAVDDRKMRIEVGQGLEGVLPDAITSRIIRHEIAPAFRDQDYDRGVLHGVTAIVKSIGGEYTAGDDDAASGEMTWKERLLVGLFVFSILGIFTFIGLLIPGREGWFLYAFLVPFYATFPLVILGVTGGLIALAIYLVVFPLLRIIFKGSALSKRFSGGKGGSTGSGRSGWSSGSGWSGGSSSSSSGRSSFSGGGGSFGGGGSSGSW